MKRKNLMRLVLLSMSAALVFSCQQVNVKDKKRHPEKIEEKEIVSPTPEVHTIKCSASTNVTTGQPGHIMGDREAAIQGTPVVPGNEPSRKCSTRNIPPAELPVRTGPTSDLMEEIQPTAHVEIAPEVEELI